MILPDTVSLFVSAAQLGWSSNPSADILPIGQAVDCRSSDSGPELVDCIRSHAENGTDPTWIFLPVRWADIERTEGILDWRSLETAMALVESQRWEPILALQSVPPWLALKMPRSDRDSPIAISSFAAKFALFSGQVAQRFGDQVQLYQLGQIANGPVPNFPFGVNPVRYGQMVRATGPVLRAADPDAMTLTAPLLPVAVNSLSTMSSATWLHRWEDTGAAATSDIVLLQPGVIDPRAPQPFALHVHPFAQGQPQGPDRWVLTSTENPQVWSVLAQENMNRAAASPFRSGSNLTRHGGTYLTLLLLPLLVVVSWLRSVPPWTKALQHWLPAPYKERQDAGWWLGTLALLGAVYLTSSWLWAVVPLVLLSGMALARPTSLWLLTLAVLPLHQIHANFLTPLTHQPFSLAPAHILTFALTPALLCRRPLYPATSKGYLAWLLGGWFLLLFLGGLGVIHTSHFSQWTRLGLFPGWLALLTLGIGLNHRNAKAGLTSLAIGISLFGLLALIQWAAGQNSAAGTLLRLSGPTFSPNHAAMLLERGLWLLPPLAGMASQRWRRIGWIGLATLTSVALLLTLSRGALTLGLLGGLLAFGISLRRMPSLNSTVRGKWNAAAIAVSALAMGIGIVFLRVGLWERFLDSTPVTARLQIWIHTWHMVKAHPWFGLGVDGFYHQAAASFPGSTAVSPDISHAHNVWLEALSRWGVAGWIWMAGLAVGIGWRRTVPTNRQSRWLMAGAAGALLAGLAHAQVDAFWHWPDVAAINLTMLLSLVALREPDRGMKRHCNALTKQIPDARGHVPWVSPRAHPSLFTRHRRHP